MGGVLAGVAHVRLVEDLASPPMGSMPCSDIARREMALLAESNLVEGVLFVDRFIGA